MTGALCGTSAFAQEEPCRQTPLLISMLNRFHYCPVELNEVTSGEIFHDFIKELDPDNVIFTARDINILSAYKTRLLVTGVGEQSCAFLKIVSELYIAGLHHADTLSGTILSRPLNFIVHDSIRFTSGYHDDFSSNETELEKRWTSRLKYKALDILFTPNGDEDPLKMDEKTLLLREADTRKKLSIREKRAFQRILEHPGGCEAYVAEVFHNTIASRYDPHTLFFSPSGKEQFQASVSKEAKAFGLTFKDEKNGEVGIGFLSPGGPAWKSNQLHQGDIVMQVKWPAGEAVDLSSSSKEEVDWIINNSGYDNMRLMVKKTNGIVSEVPLVKEKINVEQNSVTGYILQGEKKIGYISLPGFYTEWDTPNALGCANDVAKEILKLQKENIEGLILDLRNNGGGSLQEALGLLGIFIDEGPLFMTRERNQKPALMKDMNRGTVYNGPLILMVNGFSASATELVTAGLRDYNRALIVGSNTYGKAIAQVTMPLDTTITMNREDLSKKSNAYVNITIEKLYRITGVSHQKTGIVPDIELPDLYSNLDYGEASEPYAITSDRVDKKVFYTPLVALPVSMLAEKSALRTSQDHHFNAIKNLSDSVRAVKKQNHTINLELEAFRVHEQRNKELETRIGELFRSPSTRYRVVGTMYDEAILRADSYRKEMNDVLLKKITEDVYIQEGFLIMNDLILSTK